MSEEPRQLKKDLVENLRVVEGQRQGYYADVSEYERRVSSARRKIKELEEQIITWTTKRDEAPERVRKCDGIIDDLKAKIKEHETSRKVVRKRDLERLALDALGEHDPVRHESAMKLIGELNAGVDVKLLWEKYSEKLRRIV